MLRSSPPAQTHGEFPAVESVGLHSLSRRCRHHRGRHYQTRIAASHQLIVEAEAGRPGFVNKRHSPLREMLPHIIEQLLRTIGQAQRLHQSRMIGKSHCDAMLDIEPREDLVVAGYKREDLRLNCRRRFLREQAAQSQPILDNRPDIQHTCLRR